MVKNIITIRTPEETHRHLQRQLDQGISITEFATADLLRDIAAPTQQHNDGLDRMLAVFRSKTVVGVLYLSFGSQFFDLPDKVRKEIADLSELWF